ncbi:MAG: hypothetical protein HYZ28_18185 [Myxococcales bacterium]|nr:hypothetical protein [Myxococcales bacterium]
MTHPGLRLLWGSLAACLIACPRPPAPPPSMDGLYLSRRPPLGGASVVDLAGETFERKVLASTLQGVVNGTEARIFVLDGEPTGDRSWETTSEREANEFWLSWYEQEAGLRREWEGGVEELVRRFSGEVKGYVLASRSEPWTINAATTVASVEGAVVAFESERALLESAGVPQLDSMVGRWKDASSCYRELMSQWYPKMPHRGLGILSPEQYRLRDFLVQQGVVTIYGRPTTEEWPAVTEILRQTPGNLPVYGYVALTGLEELGAVKALSEAGKFLIPTDTTPNLSFHLSVVPASPPRAKPIPAADPPCRQGDLNVVLAISDGDNLALPLNRFAWTSFWRSESRGTLPLGWSLSLALRALAPGAAHYYLSTASDRDEWVAMLGVGYAYSGFYPDRRFFFSQSFERMRDGGLFTFWSLDPDLYGNSTAATWSLMSRLAVEGHPSGVLLGYFGIGGPSAFRTSGGLPVLVASGSYDDTPAAIAGRIREIARRPEAERPPVLFLSASAWSNPAAELAAALGPLESEGVHFLLPSQALSCVP